MTATLPPDAPPAAAQALLEDGSLAIVADPGLRELAEPWMPRLDRPLVSAASAAALIRVEAGEPEVARPGGEPNMEMWGVGGWVLDGEVVIAGAEGRIGGRVELAAGRATLHIDARGEAPAIVEVSSALTIAAALLLGRLGRPLVHGAAVVARGGGAWLLAGGSFSGKTTTCVNLIRAGWDWLSDDHVVLQHAPGGALRAEGWPRRFNLDHGYAAGSSAGVRSRVDPEGFGPGRWRRTAPLAGLIFPRVEADLPTAVEPLHPAAALAQLLRHTPWLLADAGAAGPLLGLLQAAARLPAFDLRLGRDSYCNVKTLQMALSPVFGVS
ncbi:hypothetical protein [Longimicrobium sp.]|uniref:hypothetical protein n=1 Tax=Longimicrobium sp. TaxID=2029185 RepID=UPI002BDB4F87|nr:hypothetical protein [Longimicrobium sp.]HSU12791.1 hypothetical protein [Longimicrobium sp.]